MTPEAVAFWIRAPGVGELRRAALPVPGDGEVLVRALRSGISRGTEALVFRGEVPPDQYARMRAPFQEGDFPGPVKYGYLNVGVVEQGPRDLEGRTVFCLYPHQSRYVVPAAAVVPVPAGVSAERAVLAGTVETAVNALWDAPPLVGDRVSVVGAGMVGCCVAKVAAGIPGARVTLVDVDPSRATVAAALGVAFASPADADGDQDLVVHTTATSAGLETSLRLLAAETSVLDLSWYGDREIRLSLGSRFHSDRLGIRASQVGTVSPARAGRRSYADRLRLALDLLTDPAYDAVLTGSSPLAELPEVMARLADGDTRTICHTVTYEGGMSVYSVTVADHMMVAHSLRGEAFGPAQALHGATYVVEATFRREELDPDGIVVDIGLAAAALHDVVGALSYRNLDDVAAFAGVNTTTEVLARHVADELAGRLADGRLGPHAAGISAVAVTLRENPLAWASYERAP